METKLVLPQSRGDAVARPRLTELLDRGRRVRLTLVSAPAGFGKATLLAKGLTKPDGHQRPVAWVSLEESDSQPARFWTYLFLVPLDATRRWYRYHHLFAEVLQTHLLEGRREEVADLHRRASQWYDQAGEPAAAVSHALASGDIDRAADLAELATSTQATQLLERLLAVAEAGGRVTETT